jgi:clan AA aspartic protease
MIIGTVNADLQPIIRLEVVARDGTRQEVEGMVDTGFNGWLTLPPSVIATLGLTWVQRGRAVLADGSSVLYNTYEGVIEWDGMGRTVLLDEAAGIPLIGMSLIQGYELNLLASPGGSVTIRIP